MLNNYIGEHDQNITIDGTQLKVVSLICVFRPPMHNTYDPLWFRDLEPYLKINTKIKMNAMSPRKNYGEIQTYRLKTCFLDMRAD